MQIDAYYGTIRNLVTAVRSMLTSIVIFGDIGTKQIFFTESWQYVGSTTEINQP